MRTVRDIYNAYRIMPALQEHQLRVASVAKFAAHHLQKPLDTENVVLACLFHDMGNIIKSRFELLPELIGAEGREYWEKVKSDYIYNYGENEHDATIQIAQEIGLPVAAVVYISCLGFSKMLDIVRDSSREQKLCEYADMRVSPFGIVSVEERLREGSVRYAKHPDEGGFNVVTYEELKAATYELERQLFEGQNIRPEDITPESCAPMQKKLETMQI